MVKKSIKINAIFNVIYTLLSVVFPLITYPYATRVLGVENLGKVNYGSSIVSYFSLFATFGITSYAVREGVKKREKREEFNELADQLLSINMVTTIASYCLLLIVLLISNRLKDYRMLIALQSVMIIFKTLGVDWMNTIYEDYIYITIRGIITHVVSLVVLFLFVKEKNDYYIYAMLNVITYGIVCILNFLNCKKYVHLKFTLHMNFGVHIKKMMVFFANAIAVTVYVSADTTMLGWILGDYYVGIYSVAMKIYSIVKLLLVSVYSVALPRLLSYISERDEFSYKMLFTKMVSVMLLLLIPAATGICVLSKEIVLLIGGPEFIEGSSVLCILGIALIFAIMGGIITQCLNISMGKEKTSAEATIISAIVNIILNIPFICWMKHNGAAITSAISELIVFTYCAIKSRKYLIKYIDKTVIVSMIHSVIGIFVVTGVGFAIHNAGMGLWVTTIMTIGVSVLIYVTVLFSLRNPILMEIINRIRKRKLL